MSISDRDLTIGASRLGTPTLAARASAIAIVAAICFAGGLAARIAIGWGQPLWLDESWTGAVIAQPDLQHLMSQIYMDVDAPLYLVLMFGWAKLAGLSDVALRFPSLVFGLATPLVVLLWRTGGLTREERLTWSVLLMLWLPAVFCSQEARGYTLLGLLAAVQSLLFVQLIAAPSLPRAAWWAACSAATILTHYDAALLTAIEGVTLLGIHRMRALRMWPALFCFVPTLAWGIHHLPRIAAFAQPKVAWYSVLGAADLPKIASFLFGPPLALFVIAALCLAARLVRQPQEVPAPAEADATARRALVVLAACAATAVGVFVAAGFLRPVYTPRYLTPMLPGVMLGAVLVTRPFARRWRGFYPAVMATYLVSTLALTAVIASRPRMPSYEGASDLIMRNGVRHLVFALDSPESAVLLPAQLAPIGGFFFRRAGDPVTVTPLFLRPGDDASRRLLRVAAAPHSAILWLYDLRIHDTVARTSPPRIAALDPSWACRNDGHGPHGVIVCLDGARTQR